MNVAERRNEIISILTVRRQSTVKELAKEFNVSVRTIKSDIFALSFSYPIYTKTGSAGGIFMGGHYNPHRNSLTISELKTLLELYENAEERHKEILARILHKYGPDKLEI